MIVVFFKCDPVFSQAGLCGRLPELRVLRLGEWTVFRLLLRFPESVRRWRPVAVPAFRADGHGGRQHQLQLGGDGEGRSHLLINPFFFFHVVLVFELVGVVNSHFFHSFFFIYIYFRMLSTKVNTQPLIQQSDCSGRFSTSFLWRRRNSFCVSASVWTRTSNHLVRIKMCSVWTSFKQLCRKF